jgi:hypothetical protein
LPSGAEPYFAHFFVNDKSVIRVGTAIHFITVRNNNQRSTGRPCLRPDVIGQPRRRQRYGHSQDDRPRRHTPSCRHQLSPIAHAHAVSVTMQSTGSAARFAQSRNVRQHRRARRCRYRQGAQITGSSCFVSPRDPARSTDPDGERRLSLIRSDRILSSNCS